MNSLFLDIETTGLSRSYDEITTIVWYHKNKWGRWIAEVDDPSPLLKCWNASDELVTYNGKCFDEPFLCRTFELEKHLTHVDLRYVLARQGIKGGLKAISTAQGLKRPDEINGVDGFLAVQLWNAYQAGDSEALNCLLYYNAWDVRLLVQLYNRFVSNTVTDCFPEWKMNPQWLETFISNRPPPPVYERRTWEYTAPRSAQDMTVEIVSQLKAVQGVTENMAWIGNVIAFTGQMVNREGVDILRKEARRIANSVGFVWIDDVRKGCTHLVASNSLGHETTKARRARELGVTIITPKGFWEMVDFG